MNGNLPDPISFPTEAAPDLAPQLAGLFQNQFRDNLAERLRENGNTAAIRISRSGTVISVTHVSGEYIVDVGCADLRPGIQVGGGNPWAYSRAFFRLKDAADALHRALTDTRKGDR